MDVINLGCSCFT